MKVELWRFPVSHYCDHIEYCLRMKAVPYEVVKRRPPARADAEARTGHDEWPFLVVDGRGVRWDDALAWAEKAGSGPSLWPSDPALSDQARRVENVFTRSVGHAARRVLFRAARDDLALAYTRYRADTLRRKLWTRLFVTIGARRVGATPWALSQDEPFFEDLFAGRGLLPPPTPGRPLFGPTRTAADVAVATMLTPVWAVPKYEGLWGDSPLWRWMEAEVKALRALPVPGAPAGKP